MSQLPISEPAEARITEPDGSVEALAAATARELTAAATRFPTCLAAWAALGEDAPRGGRPVQACAYFRVGYHRGLDRIRGAGWRGSGRVPWPWHPAALEPRRGHRISRCRRGEPVPRWSAAARRRACRRHPDAPARSR